MKTCPDAYHCPVEATIDIVGGKHKVLILWHLSKHGVLRYDYFNLDDTKIFRDHRKLLYPAPACTDGGQFYYKLQHLSWTKLEEAARRVDQALRKKQPGLVFHWRGGYLTREVLTDLCTQIDAAAHARARAAARFLRTMSAPSSTARTSRALCARSA